MAGKDVDKRKLPFTKIQAACVAVGLVLYMAMELAAGMGKLKQPEEGMLKRSGPGQGDTSYQMLVKGLDWKDKEKKLMIEIPVRERQYTDEQVEKLFHTIQPELVKQMLGENESLDEVRTNLNLRSRLGERGVKISWESDKPEWIDAFGMVHNEEAPNEGEPVWLRAKVTVGGHQRRYQYKVIVYPPYRTSEEKAVAAFKKWVDKVDLQQQTEDSLSLPTDYEGMKLFYESPKESGYHIFLLLGILSAVLIQAKEEIDKQNRTRKREQLLLLDYSEIVSKLVVYIGAGLTVRGAWERVAAGYEEAVRQGKRGVRPAYEEMVRTARQLSTGQSEGRAYSEYGRRCGIQSYVKLSALLEQGQKNGSRQLRPALEIEMATAFEQRKNLAKKLGEEAGTRLLLPLLLMLGVVMVIIVVPAFLAFYIGGG